MRRVSLVSLFVAALMGLACLVPMLAQAGTPYAPVKLNPAAGPAKGCMTPRQPDSVARLVQPSVVSIDPSWGRNIESVSVTNLAGDNFVNGATVRLTAQWKPDIMAADVSVASSSRITCTFDLRKAPSGRRDLVVTNPGGKSSTLAGGFTVLEQPYVTEISPASGGPWTTITIKGFGFGQGLPGSLVRFYWLLNKSNTYMQPMFCFYWTDTEIKTVVYVPFYQTVATVGVITPYGPSNGVVFTVK